MVNSRVVDWTGILIGSRRHQNPSNAIRCLYEVRPFLLAEIFQVYVVYVSPDVPSSWW
jgi:hypothetical protein